MQDVLIQNSLRNKFINFSNAKVRNAWIKSQGGVLQISNDRDDQMGGKIPWSSNKAQKIPGPKINPQKSHAVFPGLKIFQKALNDIIPKIN